MDSSASSNPSGFQQLVLLLIGRTGRGKRSTGNSILGKETFSPRSSSIPSITDISSKNFLKENTKTIFSIINNIVIEDEGEIHDSASKQAEFLLSFCPNGIAALLIILKYGDCDTEKESKAIDVIKAVYGEEVVKDCGIIVMTHGDDFEAGVESQEHGSDEKCRGHVEHFFQNWCKEQTGYIKSLYEDTKGRWVLFDNKTKDDAKKKHQRDTLFSIVEQIHKTSGKFKATEAGVEINCNTISDPDQRKSSLKPETQGIESNVSVMATPPSDSSSAPKINILLAGRVGNGKSSTGNSILGEKKFVPSSSSKTWMDTPKPNQATCTISDKTVNVVDAIEIDEFGIASTKDAEVTHEMAREAFETCPEFSALLIVLKYGICFTRQEQEAVQMIRSIFVENALKKHCIIVMTHGDNFELDAQDEKISFEDWCKRQTGAVKDLYEETNGRWVLFNNRTKDEEQKAKQQEKLLSIVEDIQNTSGYLGRNEGVANKNIKTPRGSDSKDTAQHKEDNLFGRVVSFFKGCNSDKKADEEQSRQEVEGIRTEAPTTDKDCKTKEEHQRPTSVEKENSDFEVLENPSHTLDSVEEEK